MRCPYLLETTVKSCLHASSRAIVPGAAGSDRCVSPDYARCGERPGTGAARARCPYLDEGVMQYCGTSAVRKFVPYNESFGSRCASEGYRYCEAYLDAAMPGRAGAACPPAALQEARQECVDGIRVPEWLRYTPNHLWLDLGEDGYGHIGIDGLFARALETVEEISYLTLDGTARPLAVLTAQGIDVLVAFPCMMRILGPNLYLRADPRKLMRDPYSVGWLFEVRQAAGQPDGNGFKTGHHAVTWMRREAECLRRYPRPSGREDLIRMFHEFFSPMASREMEA